MIRRITTIDAHAAGEPLRLVVGGIPAPAGATMLDKRASLRRRRDRLRRALLHEPRGHAGMYGALLTEPVSPGADAGILFRRRTWSSIPRRAPSAPARTCGPPAPELRPAARPARPARYRRRCASSGCRS